jgi:hypothetical protein
MTVDLVKCVRLLPVLVFASSCTPADPADTRLPYATTFSMAGDTVVASTTGDVPDSLVRHLIVDWRIQTDTASDIIGDIHSMAVTADGQVWVWDNTTPALWLVAANGAAMRRIGRRGSGPGEYRSVNDIAVARDGALVMWDDGNARLNIYNADGTHRTTAALTFTDCCGLPVTIDTLNRIWLRTHPRTIGGKEKPVDPAVIVKDEIGYLRFDASGRLVDTVMAPTLTGADLPVTALHITSTGFGGATRQVPYATYPRHAVSPLGHVVSVMSRPYAVHTRAGGRPVRVTREFAPPPVHEEERAQQRANIEFTMRRVKSDFRWNGPEIPHEKPPIDDVAVGLDGRIWVQLSVPSEEFEPDPPSGPAEDRPPPISFRPRENRWDAFEADGRYLGRIAAPRAVSVYVRRGTQLWGVIRDENDVAAIVRMRIEPGIAPASTRAAAPRAP